MAIEFRSGINLLGQLASAIGANLSSGKLLGRSSAGSGSIEEISIGSNLTLSGGVLSAAAGGVNGYVAGNWVLPYQGTLQTGSILNANTISLVPFFVSKNISINGLGARVAVVATGNVQLAIYGSGSNRLPVGTPLASTGNLSSSTATTISSAVTSFSLTAGEIYWGAINASAAPQMQALSNSSPSCLANYVGASGLSTISTASTSVATMISISGQTFGTWPDVTSLTKTISQSTQNAVIFLQIASVP